MPNDDALSRELAGVLRSDVPELAEFLPRRPDHRRQAVADAGDPADGRLDVAQERIDPRPHEVDHGHERAADLVAEVPGRRADGGDRRDGEPVTGPVSAAHMSFRRGRHLRRHGHEPAQRRAHRPNCAHHIAVRSDGRD